MTKIFLVASASELNISINEITNFKNETHETAFKKYIAVKILIWVIWKNWFFKFYIFGDYFLFMYIFEFFEKFLYWK